VDIEATLDAGGGYNVGWIAPGEWLEYTVNVSTSGTYRLDVRVASAVSGGTFHVEVGGTNVSGTLSAPGTGGWQAWTTVSVPAVSLVAGLQEMRLAFDSGSFNVNSITFTLVSASGGGTGGAAGGGAPAPGSGGGRDGKEGCGATGAEVLLLLAGLRLRRRPR
jgi:hypothetical protein